MATTGRITTFYADHERSVAAFPRTKAKAVSDDSGVALDVLLDEKMPLSGGKLTGPLVLTEGVHYGSTLPSDATEGRIFFLKV